MKGNILGEAISAVETLVNNKVRPRTSSCLRSSVVAVFTADQRKGMQYSNLIGLLQLEFDRIIKCYVLRVYNMETLAVSLQVQLYYGFGKQFKRIKPNFCTFQYLGGILGLLFKSSDEAELMKQKIYALAPKIEDYEEMKRKEEQKNSTSLLSRLKRTFFPSQQEPISLVQSFKKEQSISYDTRTGKFITEGIPSEWMELFSFLGLGEEDLEDREITRIILEETVYQQAKNEAEEGLGEGEERYLQKGSLMISSYSELTTSSEKSLNQNDARAQLMHQIRNNKIKLRHVETKQKMISIDLTNMNRQDRIDHAERIRRKLAQRRLALNRRKGSSSSDSQ